MMSDYKRALDFVNKHKISIDIVDIERNHPHPYNEGEIIDLYSVKISRGNESFIKKWSLDDLDLDDEDYTFPELFYGVLHRIPTYVQPNFEEYAMDYFGSDYETVDEEEKRIPRIWYANEIELHENAKRVFGDLFDELDDVMSG